VVLVRRSGEVLRARKYDAADVAYAAKVGNAPGMLIRKPSAHSFHGLHSSFATA
jgi:hypothetical protein